MMHEKVIITPLSISQLGQIRFFDIKIPRDAKRIIGIETSISKIFSLSPGGGGGGGGSLFGLKLNRSIYMGEFRLISCGKANIFYAQDLTLGDVNIGQGDFTTAEFTSAEFTHQDKKEEEAVNEDGAARLIKGVYRDRQNPMLSDYTYTVKIYLWYEEAEFHQITKTV
jgi:hypothetical protein